ncbi:hypothetical protein [Sphingomonas cavernae]|uniref:Uncharacterized protein n=1 Tax=Sphingomonas cavernae TaxID=2320861 RepID=A0A418WL81_9SPHN|nr:hypothetical protein [Sphingomonas cavernae]RJF90783.1 hypothetical protein D3876_11360 [Sphingomonas cavernae]
MLERLETRLDAMAVRAKQQVARRMAERLAQEFPDMRISPEPDRVVLEARGLLRRLFVDVRLRWIGALLK